MENNEIRDDEVISVEPGQEESVKTVEEEIADVTPTEAPTEAPSEEPSEKDTEVKTEEEPAGEKEEGEKAEEESEEVKEESKEDEPKEESSESSEGEETDTTSSEEPSEEKQDNESEKVGEDPTEPPAEEEEKSELDELEKARAELAELKEAEATRQMVEQISNQAAQAEAEIARVDEMMQNALTDTFKQYGIELDKTLDELRESDPAKAAIAQDLLSYAEALRNQKVAELQAPVVEAQKSFVIREASKVMSKYEMTDEQASIAADSLLDIFAQAGLRDVDADLKAKVELAVARAKMIAPKVEKVVEEVKEIVEDTKEAIKDVIAEEAPKEESEEKQDAPDESAEVEEVKEEPSEAPSEAPVANLEAFKESAAEGDAIVNNREGVTVDNVLQKLTTLPFKQRTAFYQQYADLIREAGIQKFKNQGLQ